MSATQEAVHHPVFARLWDRLSRRAEDGEQGQHRDELLKGLAGRVIEVGAGNGVNFGHYPTTVTEVLAIEPERHLRERAAEAANSAPLPVRVVDGVAGRLPAEDGEFDAAVACLVLCSVPDQAQALAEIRRVLRPGGELRFYEHVIARGPAVARAMRLSDRLFWTRVAGGCHMSRDTTSAIEAAGFTIESCRRFPYSPVPLQPGLPHILGTARRSGTDGR